jgi:maltokinase
MSGLGDPQVAEQVMAYITEARWFAGKGRLGSLVSLTPLPWLSEVTEFYSPAGPPAVRLVIAEVAYAVEEETEADAQPRELYQLAVSYRQAPHPDLHHAEIARVDDPDLGPAVAYDAARDPEACRVLLKALIGQRRLADRDASVRFRTTDAPGLTADLEPRVFTGQQSNTSVMLGDVALIKLFRRLELGRNLDIEIHDALNRAGNADVASLFGWAEGSWTIDGQTYDADLAMVVEQLKDAVDGWDLALDSLRPGGSRFTAEAEALGVALAETHQALRQAFPSAEVSGAGIAQVMKQRLAQAAAAAPVLLGYTAGLARRFDDLGAATLPTQRVHGDFHLGQTLHTPGGWKIIDFEGEPAKSMAERLAPDSAWRDVAGMLRSFDYAAASVPGPDSATWLAECRRAFLHGYAGGDLSETDSAVVRAYEADKAVYEVVYEVRNRPDWVEIPLGAVAALAQSETIQPAQSIPFQALDL